MRRVAEVLGDLQLVLLCGRNDRLLDALRAMRRRAPHAAVGFTPQVADYLRAGDFLIGKPGPGAISEALHCGLPVVTFRNAWTMPQERYNAQWVEERGVGRVVASTRALPSAVASLLVELDAVRDRVNRIENRAVFEVVDLLARLLGADASRPAPLEPQAVLAA
jgi:UDP-N-acetylglucosamine:LPS N-acetylglucosamine transferase